MTKMDRAMALEDAGNFAAAAAAYTELSDRGDKAAAFNLARMHLKSGHVEAAIILFGRLADASPTDTGVLRGLAMGLMDAARTLESVAILQRIVDLHPTEEAWRDLCLYSLHLPGDPTEVHARWGRTFAHLTPPSPVYPAPHSPLRIGYLCPSSGTAYRHFLPVLGAHTAAVDTYVYSDLWHKDPFRSRLASSAGHFRNCIDQPDDAVARDIREDGIDVLVNLRHGRPGVFARRPARQMFSYIGHAHWTGIDGVELIEGPLAFDASNLWPSFVPRTGPPVFGSLNRVCKITGEVAAAWGRILAAMPSAQLVVAAQGGELNGPVRRMLELGGVPANRLRLMDHVPDREYYTRLDDIDIVLDAWPFNGITTTCDALCAGLPVVTWRGNDHRSRVGSVLVERAGGAMAVGRTEENYISTAIAAACTIGQWRECRPQLAIDARRNLSGRPVALALEARWLP